jgi:hypothetical protein
LPLRSFNNTAQEKFPIRRLVNVETVLSVENARDSCNKYSTIEHSLQENTDSPGMRYNRGKQNKSNLEDSELASPMHKLHILSLPVFPGDFFVEREAITSYAIRLNKVRWILALWLIPHNFTNPGSSSIGSIYMGFRNLHKNVKQMIKSAHQGRRH